jgi:O-antigen/teichoic acid export membrane protein
VLSIEELGLYGHYLRVYAWLVALAGLVLPPVLIRYTAELSGAGRWSAARAILRRSIQFQSGCAALLLSVWAGLTWWHGDDLAVASGVAAAFLATAFVLVVESWLRGEQRFGVVAKATLHSTTARILGLGALLLFGGGLAMAIWIFALSQFVALGLMAGATLAALRSQRGRIDTAEPLPRGELRRRVGEYALAMGGGGLLSLVSWGYIEVFLLGWWWEGREGMNAQLAFYTMAITVSALPMRLGKVVSGALFPAFSQAAGSGEFERLGRAYRSVTVLSTITGGFIALLAIALAAPAVRLVFPEDLAPMVLPLQLLLIPTLFLAMNHAGGAVINILDGHRFYFLITLIAVPVNLALDWMLIPRWGAVGAAGVNAIVQSATIVVSLSYVARVQRLGFPGRQVVGTLAAGVVAALVGWGISRLAGTSHLGSAAGLLGGGATAVLVYILGLRLLRVVGVAERGVLGECGRLLPPMARPMWNRVLTVLAP